MDDFAEHSLSTSEPDSFYDEEDKSLDGSDSDNVSYIFITILIITISFVSLSILIVMFIRHKAFFISHNKGKNFSWQVSLKARKKNVYKNDKSFAN